MIGRGDFWAFIYSYAIIRAMTYFEQQNNWRRVCQECGYVLITTQPPKFKSEAEANKWIERPCPRCKSEAFDYGSNYPPNDFEEDET